MQISDPDELERPGPSIDAADGETRGAAESASWVLSRRHAMTLMASALAAGAAPWATAGPAAAKGRRRIDPPEVITLSGAHTTSALTVCVIDMTQRATDARVVLYNAATGVLVATSDPQPVRDSDITHHTFDGLAPSTRYKYVPELKINGSWITYADDSKDGQVGWCWTMPTRDSSYDRKVVLLGCQKTVKSDEDGHLLPYSYQDVWEARGSVTDLVHLGDFHYREIERDSPKHHVDAYKDQLAHHHYMRRALRVAGLVYTPSDHEAGANNAQSGGAAYTLAGHEAIGKVFPMHPFAVPARGAAHEDLTRLVECGRMLWVIPDFRNYQRSNSDENYAYEQAHPGDPTLKYRAFGADVTEAMATAMDAWRADGGIVVYWSDPVPYSQIIDGVEHELLRKTDAYASYPATRAHLFPKIDEGIFSDYHNVADDDGTNNLHGNSGWFGCSGQWAKPTYRGGSYQFLLDDNDGHGREPRSVYATIEYHDSGTQITSTKTAFMTYPRRERLVRRVTTFPSSP